MPRISLDTISTDSFTNWSVYGSAATPYEAVRRDSGDTTGITSSTLGALANFVVSGGYYPKAGFIYRLTVKCRCRKTDPLSVGGSLRLRLYNDLNGLPFAFTTSSISSSWTWLEIKATSNLSGGRFSYSDIYKLKAYLYIQSLPSSGSVEISEVYVQEDYVEDAVYRYDPFFNVVPNAVVGPLQWTTTGTQPALISLPYLRISDASIIDHREYQYSVQGTLPEAYGTYLETTFYIGTLPTTVGTFYTALAYQDATSSVELVLFRKADSTIHLCLTDASRLHDDFDSCIATTQLTDFTTTRVYTVGLSIDRESSPAAPGRVKVFVDYQTSPVLECYYAELAPGPFLPQVFFGTKIPHACGAYVAYVVFSTHRSHSSAFRAWDQFEGPGVSISADSSDPGICQLVPLSVAPDVMAGQSHYACKLSDLSIGSPPCGVRQITKLLDAAPASYKLDVEYRDNTGAGSLLRVTIQRTSDLFYWDDGAAAWTSVLTYVDLPSVLSRTSATVATAISDATPYELLITLEHNFGLVMLPPEIWIYRVYLASL